MTKQSLWQKPLSWLLFFCLSICSVLISYYFFPKAFPIIHLDLVIDRMQALQRAQELSALYNWGPQPYQEATSFQTDSETKNFIELEGGGKETLRAILQEKDYAPYTWKVRHFKENTPEELVVEFWPDGMPYSFLYKIPENLARPSLNKETAQERAQEWAERNWLLDLKRYDFIESSQETMPNGRVDYTFIYALRDKKVGKAPYRLSLKICGDLCCQVQRSIKVPEGFKRRYEEMRSYNKIIAFIAQWIMVILYILGGCLFGLIYLMRKHWITWQPAFTWGFIIAFLLTINEINEIPLAWMSYQTEISKTTFIGSLLLNIVLTFLQILGLYTLIIAVAESLTRKAFPEQIQFFKSWRADVATSYEVIGRTFGGYLLVSILLAFVILFYLGATRFFGWWSPSDALIDPNILATYIPWLSAIARSLGAGFMEECLFRAIPLAGAALIGQKLGHRRLFLIGAFVIQILVFGAGHATYATQPAYARLIELIIPSTIFGLVYLYYGLLPGIICHFIFDVIWFALPLFVSTATYIIIQQLFVIAAALVPIWVIVWYYKKQQHFHTLSDAYYNFSWQPHPLEQQVPTTEKSFVVEKRTISHFSLYGFLVLASSLSLITLLFIPQQPRLTISRTQADSFQKKWLKEQGVHLGSLWHPLIMPDESLTKQHRFIWQHDTTPDKKNYYTLLTSYLTPPSWLVRLINFDENVANRAQEYNFIIDGNTLLRKIDHQMPEHSEGKNLSEQEARSLAHRTLKEIYNLDHQNLEEISALSEKHPSRTDWLFTYADHQASSSKEGQARISITIRGDTIAGYYRFIFTPESWNRDDARMQYTYAMLKLIALLIIGIFFGIIAVQALLSIIKQTLPIHIFLIIFGLMSIKSCLQLTLMWPYFIATTLKTTEPYQTQIIIFISRIMLQSLLFNSIFALVGAYIYQTFRYTQRHSSYQKLMIGITSGLLLGIITILYQYIFSTFSSPATLDYTFAGSYIPALSIALNIFTQFIQTTILYLILMHIVSMLHRSMPAMLGGLLLSIIYSLALIATIALHDITSWLLGGLILGLTFYIINRVLEKDLSIVPIIAAANIVYQACITMKLNLFQGSIFGNVLGILFIAISLASWLWYIKK